MIYLLTGENTFELEQRLTALTTDFDGDVERIDGSEVTPEMLPDLFSGATLFSSKRLIVIKNTSANKTLWTSLSEWLEKGVDNDIAFFETNPDKRTKTYKWLEKHAEVSTVHALKPFEAVQWLMSYNPQGAPLQRDVAEFMVDYVGVDQWRLSSELQKLHLSGKVVTKELVRELVEPSPQATAFELLDAAFTGERERQEEILTVVEAQEDPYMFFGLLAWQVLAIAAVKFGDGKQPDDIARDMGIHPFVVRKVSRFAQSLSQDAAKQLVARLSELDVNMKSRSVDPWTQVRSFLSLLHS